MIMTEHIPSSPLNAYINTLYYIEGQAPYTHLEVLPIPSLNLMISFYGSYRCYKADRARPFATKAESWSMGVFAAHHRVDWPPNMQLLVVSFKPGGAYPFLHLPLAELRNDIVSLDALWGNLADEMRERLYGVPTVQARFALLEQLLLAHLRDVPYGLNAVRYAITTIDDHHGALSIQDLSDQMGISQNHLTRQFNQLVGVTPKELARIYRFRYVLSSLDLTQHIDWGRVASFAGYYDQSHLNRDIKTFTGHTPSDFLRLHRQVHIDNLILPLNFLPTG